MTRRYPTEGLRKQIIEAHCGRLPLAFSIGKSPPFDKKILSVPEFLPQATFTILRNAAERQARPERVHIPIHKRGATISYHDLHYFAPEIIAFYLSPELHDWCSGVIGEPVGPTPLNDLSSCSLLIYDQANDHIGWHYDLDFYRGRHFTALFSLVNTDASGAGLSSAKLLVRSGQAEIVIPTPPNTLVLFEGAHVHHSVSSLRALERRVIVSMTFCTDPSATVLQTWQRRFKDIAYFGWRALWT